MKGVKVEGKEAGGKTEKVFGGDAVNDQVKTRRKEAL